ncbi:hypothetical protein [Patulibacter sp.]|uniref:hypothetical protein n=1 Tax=Patulibacter sp. TaxID=1912859 RepID=UPI00272002E3|nr:hypothetical protein [Patulibacter sp.]MDO9410657.1 hypothetical protein [Patulibacter sp.]
MDSWYSGLFDDDDLAADVRGDWEAALAGGTSPARATRRLVEDWVDEVAGSPSLAASFWIALAALQLHGRVLETDVRDRAIRAIGRGEDLQRWEPGPYGRVLDEDPDDDRDEVAQRRHVTTALRARLVRAPVVDGVSGAQRA